jgi:hypothetical protein
MVEKKTDMKPQEEPKPKIGAGHFWAWLRQGLRELRAIFYPESNVAQPAEYGLFGTKTPGEVAESRRADERDLDEEPQRGSVLDDRLRQAERNCDDRGREPADDHEMDR